MEKKHIKFIRGKGPRGPRGFAFAHGDHEFKVDADVNVEEIHGMDCCSGPRGRRGRHRQHNVFQKIDDDVLSVAFVLPGMDKSTIKLRSNPDSMVVEASGAESYNEIMGERKMNLSINTKERIDPATAKAKYSEGVLLVTAKLANPPTEVIVD